MAENEVIDIARTYAEKVRCIMHPKAVILYGSHAKGTATIDSDIDVFVPVSVVNDLRRRAVEELLNEL